MEYALGIGADTSQGAPGDALEYSAAAGAAAFLFGREKILAVCEDTYAYMTDTPDFWRREYQYYPRHAGRFTGEPAYFKHILRASGFAKGGTTPGFPLGGVPSAQRAPCGGPGAGPRRRRLISG
jgi:hydroxymethylglutaryl-CoA synthase